MNIIIHIERTFGEEKKTNSSGVVFTIWGISLHASLLSKV